MVHTRFLEHCTCAIGEEEIGSLDNQLEFWSEAIRMKQLFNIVHCDSIWTASARHEQIGSGVGG